MGLAISRRQAPDRIALDRERAAEEERRASIAYLAWPLAIVERIAPRDEGSHWYRFHLRQALWFGNLAVAAGFLALVWPLVASAFVASVGATIWIYAFALLIDAVVFVVWLVSAVRYSRRAGRGEFFVIPWVARLTGGTTPPP